MAKHPKLRTYWIDSTAGTAKDRISDLEINIIVKFLKILICKRKY